MLEGYVPSAEQIALEAGITPTQARATVTAALRALHRCSVTDYRGVTAGLMEAYFCFGSEACYHFVGILEVQRTRSNPGLPWAETVERFAPDIGEYRALLDKWIKNDESGAPDALKVDPPN